MRIFGKRDLNVSKLDIFNRLESLGLGVSISIDFGASDRWSLITISDNEANEITQIERNDVYQKSAGQDELIEFETDIKDCKPQSAVEWLLDFFKGVTVIYTFQIFDFPEHTSGWQIIGEVKTMIMNITNGIIQADHEGFSNEDGYHILWQFPDHVEGEWFMAVLDSANKWIHFKMDLGNTEHRIDFMDGKVPQGVKAINY